MNLSSQQILGLIESSRPDDQRQLRDIVVPESVWLELIGNRPDVRRAVTLNKHLPHAVLARLAVDADPNVRCDVAMKRALPLDVFSLLAADEDESVRHTIALNAKVPREALQRLANDSSRLVSEAARIRIQRLEK